MTHDEVFTLAEHLILLGAIFGLIFVSSQKLAQVHQILADFADLLARLERLGNGLERNVNDLGNLDKHPPAPDDTTTGAPRA